MKHLIPVLLISMCVSVSTFADDNTVNCEVVVQAPIDLGAVEEEGKSAQIATFLPADDFIFSVFGAKIHMDEVDGKPILAVMCTRSSIVPSEFDLKIIRTNIPFYLSSNFDSPDSAFLGVSKTKDGYAHSYAGPDLSIEDTDLLKIRMKALNNVED